VGGRSTLLGCVGADSAGGRVLDELIREHVDVRGVQRLGSESTAESIVIVEPGGARTIVAHSLIDLDKVPPPPDDLLDHIDDVAVVLVDARWPTASLAALRSARQWAVPGIVDVDRLPADEGFCGELFAAASHLVFSEAALRSLSGIDDPAEALRSVRRQTAAHLSVTLGERGVVWIDGEQSVHLPAFVVSAVDTTGAGDVFHGAFALALAEGADERCGFEFAAATAAIKCSRPGARAGTPHRGDVVRFLNERRAVQVPSPA
jgi:sulfofructose kinase